MKPDPHIYCLICGELFSLTKQPIHCNAPFYCLNYKPPDNKCYSCNSTDLSKTQLEKAKDGIGGRCKQCIEKQICKINQSHKLAEFPGHQLDRNKLFKFIHHVVNKEHSYGFAFKVQKKEFKQLVDKCIANGQNPNFIEQQQFYSHLYPNAQNVISSDSKNQSPYLWTKDGKPLLSNKFENGCLQPTSLLELITFRYSDAFLCDKNRNDLYWISSYLGKRMIQNGYGHWTQKEWNDRYIGTLV